MRAPDHDSRPAHLQLLAISWNFGWPVAAGVIVGYWLDEKLGSSPLLTLALGLGAMAAAVWRLIRLSNEEVAERRADEEEARRSGESKSPRRGDGS